MKHIHPKYVDHWMFQFVFESVGTDQLTSVNKQEGKMLLVIGGSQGDSQQACECINLV